MNEFQTKERCENYRMSSNDKFMEEIKQINTHISDISSTLKSHILVEERGANMIKGIAIFGFGIIATLLGIIWNNLNDKIDDIQKGLKAHDAIIQQLQVNYVELNKDSEELKKEAEEHKKEDKKYYK